MERPSWRQVTMDRAFSIARRSTCKRLQVGCVIVPNDYRGIIAEGYNGNASSLPNGCDSEEPGKCGCLHAEENACILCDVPRGTPKIVFTTDMPCRMCAKRLINLGGVQRVYYARDYRLRDGLEILSQAGIQWEKLVYAIPPVQELATVLVAASRV